MHAQPKLDRYLPRDTPGRLGSVDLKHLASRGGGRAVSRILTLSGKSSDLVIDQVTVKSYQVTQVSDTSMTRTTLPNSGRDARLGYGSPHSVCRKGEGSCPIRDEETAEL